jgi:hypothetical protein
MKTASALTWRRQSFKLSARHKTWHVVSILLHSAPWRSSRRCPLSIPSWHRSRVAGQLRDQRSAPGLWAGMMGPGPSIPLPPHSLTQHLGTLNRVMPEGKSVSLSPRVRVRKELRGNSLGRWGDGRLPNHQQSLAKPSVQSTLPPRLHSKGCC